MKTSKNKIKSLMLVLVLSVAAISTASARVCFLPDSTDCGSSDVNIPDVPCKYYSCKEAGGESNAYQTCYNERIYNNGGVNVECKQVKCNISKSDCEAQAKATSQSCKFDDASGCYYLGECKQCNKDLYDLKEPKSGSDWECDSCTGCDGTFYSCTAKEKECKDINSSYTSSCSDSQTAEKVEGIKDSKGNQCYTCKDKPIDKCVDIAANYNLSDSDGITKRYPSINASVTYGKLLGNATYGCGFSVARTGELNTYTLSTTTVKPGIIGGTDYASVVGIFIKDIEYWAYLGGRLYFEHGGYCYSGLCGKDLFGDNKDAYLRTKMEIPNELGLYSETAGYCCSSIPGMVKDFKQCVATPKLEKHHQAFYFCKEGALKDNKCYETTYSCSEGYNLVGDKCILPEATCPDGYALDSSKSTSTSYVCSKINYYCENNDKHILSGDKCLCKTNGKIYTIWVEDQETSKQQHEIQWLKSIKRTITTNSQAEVDVVSTAQVNHERCSIDSATNALNCSHIVSGPIGTLGPDLMNLSKKANGVYTYLNAESEDGSGYYTDVNWKKFSVSINNKIYPVSGIYSQCAETAVIADNGDIYQVKCGKAQTCSDYDKTYIETSSIKDNDDPEDICPYLYSSVFGYVKNLGNGNTDLKVGEYKFKFGGGDNAEFVDASVEGCTACRWKTCEEIDSDFTSDPDLLNCEQGYAPEIVKANWAVGSDGRCYECALDRSIVEIVYERSGYNADSCDDFNSTNKIEWDVFYDVMHNSGRWFDESKGLPFKVQVVSNYLPTCTEHRIYGEPAEATLILPKGAREVDIYHTYVSNFSYEFLTNYRDKCVKEYNNDLCHYVHNMPLGLSDEEIKARKSDGTVFLISFNENEDGIPIEKSQYYIDSGNILYNNVYYYFGREQ